MSEPVKANHYLKNLDKWQAYSHPDLVDRKPEELFPPDFAERYGHLHRDVWQRIVRLHGTIRTLETLEPFPFQRIYAPTEMQFWGLVWANFGEMAIVLLHGLVNDKVRNAKNLLSFKKEVGGARWLDGKLRAVLLHTWRERKLDEDARSIAASVRVIRHERIAHRIFEDGPRDSKKPVARVSLGDLRKLFDSVHALFGALSFGSACVTLPGDLMPGTVDGKPTRTCLDEVLDAVLRDSYFVNHPEKEKQWWSTLREHIPQEELKAMNELRKRVGLSEA